MNKLSQLLEALKTYIPQGSVVNETVSASSIGWHIDHSLLVISQIIKAMEASDPADYQFQLNMKRILAFTLNRFPRGAAKAPKAVKPVDTFDAAKTILAFDAINSRLKVLASLQPNQFFLHPFFGKLNQKAAIKMLGIHTDHHLRIIKDILQKQA